MKLSELLAVPAADVEITGLALDSRKVKAGDVFLAVAGSRVHGLEHVHQAIDQGAAAVVFEPAAEVAQLADAYSRCVPMVPLMGLSQKLGAIAARFFGEPSTRLRVIGFTGTNGKTSCSQFLAQAMGNFGIIGTLGWGVPGRLQATPNTTPDGLTLQTIIADFVKQGLQGVAMEVSSHALQQGRINGMHFEGAVYTNISRDHLDYHGSMEDYLTAKLELLRQPGLRFAVVNLDDRYCEQILNAIPVGIKVWGYSKNSSTNGAGVMELLLARAINHRLEGVEFVLQWRERDIVLKAPVFGDFNVENLLAVVAAMLAIGVPLETAALRLQGIRPVAGRMERYGVAGSPSVFVDYAHTPDALQKVLASLKQHCQGQLWVVFGCGGNRDQGKRAEMGAIASGLADFTVVTDDNPRYENPEHIVRDVISGCAGGTVEVLRDRKQAIENTIARAAVNDCILVAGKGHEDYQEINGSRLPFSDTAVVCAALARQGDLDAYAAQ